MSQSTIICALPTQLMLQNEYFVPQASLQSLLYHYFIVSTILYFQLRPSRVMNSRIITKVNVSATVGMSTTVGEMSVNVRDSGGNVRNSGEIEYALRNVRLEIVIHKSA